MTTRERACRCGHGETAHLRAGRLKDCRVADCACIIYTRTSKRLPAVDGAPTTIADRAVLAARRERDRCAERMERWRKLAVATEFDVWAAEKWKTYTAALVESERTVAELERGAGVPIAADEGGAT